ncbi:MAG: ComF family protein [Ruminococcus flavefaciens]|nr:ComF family protein [Ruminococcus flavefaciens]
MPALYVLLRHLSALLYPVRYPVCNKVIGALDGFCNDCEDGIVKYNGSFRIPKVKKFISAFEYNDKISSAIFIMKDGTGGNAPYALGSAMAERIRAEKITPDFIVPVPLYRENLRKRGFNQSELIAKEISRILDIETRSDIVIKNRKTLAQKNLTRAERKNNLKNAFSVNDISAVRDKRILVIDDVCTTGSTLAEVANLLINSGAGEIYCACACKTPDLKRGEKNESR